jgi:hypothetical protein
VNKKYEKYKKTYEKYRLNNREFCRKVTLKCMDDIHFGKNNKDIVLERDNWTCQMCGMTQEQHMTIFGRSLTIDHKDGKGRNSLEKNNDLNNLWTLCLRCHGSKDRLKYLSELK